MNEGIEFNIIGNDKFSGAMGRLRSALPSVRTLALGASGAIAGVGTALFAMTKSTATAYDKVQKFSDRIGISTEAMSKYNAVAEFSGVKTEAMQMAFQRMTRRIGDTTSAMNPAVKALKELKIPIEDIQGLEPDKQFEMIAGRLSLVEDQGKKTALAMKFFDSEGVAMVQTLKHGTKGLEAMKAEAEKFGLVISAEAGANSAEFNDSISRIGMSLTGLRNSIAEHFMPAMTTAFNNLANIVATNRDNIVSAGETMAKGFMFAVNAILTAVEKAHEGFRAMQWGMSAGIQKYLNTIANVYEKIPLFGKISKNMIADMRRMADNWGGVADDTVVKYENMDGTIKKLRETLNSLGNSVINMPTLGAIGEMPEQGGLPPFNEQGMEKMVQWMEAMKVKASEFKADQLEQQRLYHEELETLYDEHMLTDTEKLDKWYDEEKKKFSKNQTDLIKLREIYLKKKAGIEDKAKEEDKKKDAETQKEQIQMQTDGFDTAENLAQLYGERGKKLTKALGIARATMSTYQAGAQTLAQVPFPANIPAMASIISTGLLQVAKIAGVADRGKTFVDENATYKLIRGERVIEPEQNKDLTEFLNGNRGGGAGGNITNIWHILENATTSDALLAISQADWMDVIAEKIIPAEEELMRRGIYA